MLHAFNQKNVRRVLTLSGLEHTNDKNEDAITSMVFSPLTFMPPIAALEVLSALVGDSLKRAVGGRLPIRHELHFWPPGLQTEAWVGQNESRCEPDFFARFEFGDTSPILVIGEMKWDWRVSADHLKQETRRQRMALTALEGNCISVAFSVTKSRLPADIPDLKLLTWKQVQLAAGRLGKESLEHPAKHWGVLVSGFLEKVEQISFQGFHEIHFHDQLGDNVIFWKE